jgi:hypothetical protein
MGESNNINDSYSYSGAITSVSAKGDVIEIDISDVNIANPSNKEAVAFEVVIDNLQEPDVVIKPDINCKERTEEDDDIKSGSATTLRDDKLMMEVFDHNVSINKSKRQIKIKLACCLSAKRRCK